MIGFRSLIHTTNLIRSSLSSQLLRTSVAHFSHSIQIRMSSNQPESAPGHAQTRSTCMKLIWEDYNTHHIEYRVFLSNHCAHGLIALQRLGASEDRLNEFYQYYQLKLEPRNKSTVSPEAEMIKKKKKEPLTSENIIEQMGLHEWMEYLKFFESEWRRIEQQPLASASPQPSSTKPTNISQPLEVERALIRSYLPRLLPYMAGHATHPLIHLGFAQLLSQTLPEPMWIATAPNNAKEATSQTVESKENSTTTTSATSPINPLTIAGLAYFCYDGLLLDNGTSKYSPESFLQIPKANSLPLLQVVSNGIAAFKPFLSVLDQKQDESPYRERPIGIFQKRMNIIGEEAALSLLEVDIQWRLEHSHIQLRAAIKEMEDLILFMYGLSPNDFFMLHGVTSYFSLCQLLPLLDRDDQILALRYALKMILAVFVARGMPGHTSPILQKVVESGDLTLGMSELMKGEPQYMAKDWSSILPIGLATNDEHTQKLIEVCRCYEANLLHSGTAAAEPSACVQRQIQIRADFARWCGKKRADLTEEEDD